MVSEVETTGKPVLESAGPVTWELEEEEDLENSGELPGYFAGSRGWSG